MTAATVLLVDDHPLFRRGLADLLVEEGAMVIAEAGTASQALEQAALHRPDIIVMDLHLPDQSGIEAIRRARKIAPESRILVLTMDSSAGSVVAALRAGARGYLLKEAAAESIGAAMRTLLRDELVLDARFAKQLPALLAEDSDGPAPALATLSPRELEIARLVAAGHGNADIGRRLFLAEKTVRNNVTAILAKTGAESRAQLQAIVGDSA